LTTPASTSTPTELPRRCWWRPPAFSAGLALIVSLLYVIGQEPYESPQVRSDRKNLERMATGNAAVFGSSHGFSVMPDKMDLDGVNLSHGGQDVFEMVYMARAVKRLAPNLKTVIFTISYFTFVFDNAAYLAKGTQTRIGRRLVMYTAFPSLDYIPGDATSYVKGLLAPVVTRDHWRLVLWPGGSRKDALPDASDLPPSPRRDDGVASASAIASYAKRRCKQYTTLMRNMTSHHPHIEADTYRTLKEASQELEAGGVRVVLVTPPYSDAYNDCFDTKRQTLTRKLARRIANETGAEYVDAGKLPEFASNREYFRNSDHLNNQGKVEFSRWLGGKLGTADRD
jgi:hypothetical protein